MKKILIAAVLTAVLAGCGGVKTTNEKYKKDLFEKIYVEKDARAKEKYKKIMAELERQAAEGSEEAEEEIELWTEAKIEFAEEKLKQKGEEAKAAVKDFMKKQGW